MIIGLSGKARSGKDTVADALVSKRTFVRIGMADQMKTVVALLFGWNSEHTHGRLKETIDDFWGMSPRQVMQRFGTDAMRREFGDDFWVRTMERQLARYAAGTNFVIPDIRFPNEAEMVKRLGGQVWRLERLDGPVIEASTHPSETALDDYKGFDKILRAPTGVENLQRLALFALRDGHPDDWDGMGYVDHV